MDTAANVFGVSVPARVISADPPWKFQDKVQGDRGAEHKYECMTVEDIMRYPLPPVADDAFLFLWCVAAMRRESLDVVRAWGFRDKAEIVWVKSKSDDPSAAEDTQMGMGHYVRNVHECCVVATRGRARVADRAVRSVFFAPRTEHSRKPDEFYALVEKLVGAAGPLVELFGRAARPGWHVYGHEVPGAEVRIGGETTRYVYTARPEVVAPAPAPTPATVPPAPNQVVDRLVPSECGASSVDGVKHKPIRVVGEPIFSDAQYAAWTRRAVADGILAAADLDHDPRRNYQAIVDRASSTWPGWAEEQIVDTSPAAVPGFAVAEVVGSPVVGAADVLECGKCGVVISRTLVKTADGRCSSCGSPMTVMDDKPAAPPPPRTAEMPFDNLSALVDELAKKRADVTLLQLTSWTHEQLVAAKAWLRGDLAKKPGHIKLRRGRPKPASSSTGAAPDAWATCRDMVEDEANDYHPMHPSLLWNPETSAEERRSDAEAWARLRSESEFSADERRVLGLKEVGS